MGDSEIKFRAWLRRTKEMIPWKIIDQQAFNDPRFHNQLLYELISKHNVSVTLDEEDDADIIVMRFTGMRDRDRKSIYEGDILCHDDRKEVKCLVLWNNKDACFDVHKHYPNGLVEIGRLFNHRYYIIVGNKYENPELIEVKE